MSRTWYESNGFGISTFWWDEVIDSLSILLPDYEVLRCISRDLNILLYLPVQWKPNLRGTLIVLTRFVISNQRLISFFIKRSMINILKGY